MSFPSHIIMDFNNNLNKQSVPYWAINFIKSRGNNPLFLQDIVLPITKTKSTTNNILWVSFFKNKDKLSIHNLNNLLTQNLTEISNYSKPVGNYNLNNLVNINFLRYERLYTKLKYSRSPAYDIVSGGFAAILAGFLGFLISEKFGFELVDSGDFYYLFMYAVFLVFILRPLLYISNVNNNILTTLSPKNIFNFFSKILTLALILFR